MRYLFIALIALLAVTHSPRQAVAQIEVKTDGSTELGTRPPPGVSPTTSTTVNGDLSVTATGRFMNLSVVNKLNVGTSLMIGSTPVGTRIRWAQVGSQWTSSTVLVDMPDLWLMLPVAKDNAEVAIVTLNLPAPYARGTDFPGGSFSILANGESQVPGASFTLGEPVGSSPPRSPTTLVVMVKLDRLKETAVKAQWGAVRNGTLYHDGATLSAIIGTLN